MSKKYLEIQEILEDDFDVPMVIRIECIDQDDAISKAITNNSLILGTKEYKYIECNHNADPALNAPCSCVILDKSLIEV